MKENLINIDGQKLAQAITGRGLSLAGAALELGFNGAFFSNCKSRNKISRAAAVSLRNRFGIMPDEYKKEEQPEILKALETENDNEKAVDTYGEILHAILAELLAIHVELETFRKDFWKMNFTSTFEALNQTKKTADQESEEK